MDVATKMKHALKVPQNVSSVNSTWNLRGVRYALASVSTLLPKAGVQVPVAAVKSVVLERGTTSTLISPGCAGMDEGLPSPDADKSFFRQLLHHLSNHLSRAPHHGRYLDSCVLQYVPLRMRDCAWKAA